LALAAASLGPRLGDRGLRNGRNGLGRLGGRAAEAAQQPLRSFGSRLLRNTRFDQGLGGRGGELRRRVLFAAREPAALGLDRRLDGWRELRRLRRRGVGGGCALHRAARLLLLEG